MPKECGLGQVAVDQKPANFAQELERAKRYYLDWSCLNYSLSGQARVLGLDEIDLLIAIKKRLDFGTQRDCKIQDEIDITV